MTVSDSPRPDDWQADAATVGVVVDDPARFVMASGDDLADNIATARAALERLVARLTRQSAELEAAERIIEAAEAHINSSSATRDDGQLALAVHAFAALAVRSKEPAK